MAVHHHIHLALKKSAKIEMKELMKGQLRSLHLPKLSSIERFKMAFVKVIELIGVFLTRLLEKWRLNATSLACSFLNFSLESEIHMSQSTDLKPQRFQWELCLLHWGGHTFHCRLQNHCDMFQGVGYIEGTMLMSAAPLVGAVGSLIVFWH